MAYLEITKGKAVVQSPLGDEAMSIGRQPGNSIVINDPDISRRHCVIEKWEGSYRIYDVGSRNGIVVNGQRIQRSELKGGDVITLGKTVARFLEAPLRPARKRSAFRRNWLIWVPAVSIFGAAAFVVAWATGMLGRDFPPDELRQKFNIPDEIVEAVPLVAPAPREMDQTAYSSATAPANAAASTPVAETPPAPDRRFEDPADRLRYVWIAQSQAMDQADTMLGRFVAARFVGKPTRDDEGRLIWELPPDGEITAVLDAVGEEAQRAVEVLEQEPLLLEAELAGVLRRDRDGSRLIIRVGVVALQRAWGNSDTALRPPTRELLNKRLIINREFAAPTPERAGN